MQTHLRKTLAVVAVAGALVGGGSAYAASTGSTANDADDHDGDGDDAVVHHRHPVDQHDSVDDHDSSTTTHSPAVYHGHRTAAITANSRNAPAL